LNRAKLPLENLYNQNIWVNSPLNINACPILTCILS
jgi:hypothetical protein